MRFAVLPTLLWTLALLTAAAPATATSRNFRIYSYRQVTTQVDRLYGTDGNAFATLFCRGNAAEVMFVDARVPDLDGVVFHFPSLEVCEAARATIRSSYRRCVTELQLDVPNRMADVATSRCH